MLIVLPSLSTFSRSRAARAQMRACSSVTTFPRSRGDVLYVHKNTPTPFGKIMKIRKVSLFFDVRLYWALKSFVAKCCLKAWRCNVTAQPFPVRIFLNGTVASSVVTISRPIAKDAVAAGDGTLHTCSIRSW